MAYQTGTATSQEDLMNALQTFASANGWTVDIMSTTNDWMALNNGSVFVQFRWDNTNAIAIFQSTAFSGTGVAPGNHTNDDGAGELDASTPYNAAIGAGRAVSPIGNGPFTAYHFFTPGTTQYIHVVLEYAPNIFRHFSFGTINKIGTWTGGQYAVGHRVDVSGQSNVLSNNHSILWSGTASFGSAADAHRGGAIRLEGMPNQTGSMRWGVFGLSNSGNDRGGNARVEVFGGILGRNPYLSSFGFFRANLLNGYVPLIPIPIWWVNRSLSPQQHMLLGYAPDIFHIQMANLTPGQEFTVGSDTFKVFPVARKQTLGGGEESRNAGLAYRKVV